jgi:hypothetical protein
MRFYNKWYKELWFWIVENKMEVIDTLIGIILTSAVIISYIYFLTKGGVK